MSKFVKTAIAAAMVMGVFTSTATINKGKAKQTLNFKAWLVGAADAPDLGNFEANTTFQITYL